jgi:hypothetical protein
MMDGLLGGRHNDVEHSVVKPLEQHMVQLVFSAYTRGDATDAEKTAIAEAVAEAVAEAAGVFAASGAATEPRATDLPHFSGPVATCSEQASAAGRLGGWAAPSPEPPTAPPACGWGGACSTRSTRPLCWRAALRAAPSPEPPPAPPTAPPACGWGGACSTRSTRPLCWRAALRAGARGWAVRGAGGVLAPRTGCARGPGVCWPREQGGREGQGCVGPENRVCERARGVLAREGAASLPRCCGLGCKTAVNAVNGRKLRFLAIRPWERVPAAPHTQSPSTSPRGASGIGEEAGWRGRARALQLSGAAL